tara:strand:+ start:359 stop:769 length:411 start_codon:yes stop_codon:yes gene_type:complete
MNVNDIAKSFTGQSGLGYGIDTAIKALRPNAKFEMNAGGGEFTFPRWDDPDGKKPPTKEQIMKEFERQKSVAEYYQYAYNRCHEYPDGFEQLDMLWHAVNSGQDLKESKWFKRIEEVKKNNPKPEGDPPPEYEPED